MATLPVFNMMSFPFLRYNSPANGSRRIHQCLTYVKARHLFPKPKFNHRLLFRCTPMVIVPITCVKVFQPKIAACDALHKDVKLNHPLQIISGFNPKSESIFLSLLTSLISIAHEFLTSTIYNMRLVMRFCRISATFGPLFSVYPLTLYFTSLQKPWYSLLLTFIQWSGPTFIKLGQWASTRRDLFSQEFCDILSKLHRDGTIHSWRHTEERLDDAFGETWRTWCQIDSSYPVYSGCIGQVYKGYINQKMIKMSDITYAKEDIPVAIKVLHPGVAELVNMDLGIMHVISEAVTLIPGVKWLSLPDIVQEFEKLMKNQIDFREEARNLDKFNKNFSKISNIRFPIPIWPYVKSDVLIETFEEGIPMSYFTANQALTASEITEGPTKKILAKMGVDALLKMVFTDNFVHADLHPGNILVQTRDMDELNGTVTQRDLRDHLQLVFLDAGIIASLAPYDFQNLTSVFTAIVLNKGHEVADLFLKHSRIHNCNNIEDFRNTMAKLVNDVHQQSRRMGLLQVGQFFNELFTLLVKHQVLLESNMASIIWGIMVLEGLGRSLDPQIDLIRLAKPVLVSKLLGS